ncbi:hypothetical protein C8Q79DRAFT_934265 [Trametes meyenii]|nr:hypothetical protein C8Q79DRAFT_934265 [Trametes meyenii]
MPFHVVLLLSLHPLAGEEVRSPDMPDRPWDPQGPLYLSQRKSKHRQMSGNRYKYPPRHALLVLLSTPIVSQHRDVASSCLLRN